MNDLSGYAEIKRRHTVTNGHDESPRLPRFKPIRFKDIVLATDPAYLVRGLLPREGVVVVWGPPKCGKSFLIFDMALHVALGWEYRGRRVQPGTVCYVACEGERGLGARSEAFRLAKLGEAAADPPFFLLTTRLNLVADVDELITDIGAAIGPDHCAAVVIDTLNRSLVGSESQDEDMAAYVRAADRLREAFGAAVIIIHHCGHNGDRPRGHSSLTAAADAQISVKRDDANLIVAEVEYMKDGAEGDIITSQLVVYEVGQDEDGETISSCVVEAAESAAGAAHGSKPKRLPDAARVALTTLRKAIAEAGEYPPASNHIPTAAQVVDIETWRRFHYIGTASDGQNSDARKKGFQRVRQQLQAAGVIGLHADLCWVVSDA